MIIEPTPMLKTLIIAAIALFATPARAGIAIIKPADPNIFYTGRWRQTDPSAPWCGWQGCSIIANFKGSAVSAKLEAAADDRDWVFVIIDDDRTRARTIALTAGAKDYILASDLPNKTHKVEIIRKSNGGKDNILTFHGLKITGSGLAPPPARPRRKFEFYGDSNLAGSSVEHEQNKGDRKYLDSYYSFAGIASRMFDAEYHNISKGGEAVHYVMKNIWNKYYPNSPKTWDFSKNSPDLVVVNLGANDIRKPKDSIIKAYNTFLDALRSTHPNAHIVVMNGFGWSYNETANYTAEVVAARKDPNMSCLHFPWVFEQWHGCQYDHSGMANYLARHLAKTLGWTCKPSDVMDGFGHNGNVANGSFEEVAPFGGYGWRYYTDKGVARITNAPDAKHGNCYLKLENEAKSHQPNPASPGDEFKVSLWIKGADDGDKAKITIEFKDQKMWTDPLDTHTEIKTLTTDWKKYTLTRKAPTATPKPVFQIKLILQAGPEDTVFFDKIKMTRKTSPQ